MLFPRTCVAEQVERHCQRGFQRTYCRQAEHERIRGGRKESSPHNFQLGHHRRIQQINRLLEPLILDNCSISLLSCLDRSMA
jgi:hypothetical protein